MSFRLPCICILKYIFVLSGCLSMLDTTSLHHCLKNKQLKLNAFSKRRIRECGSTLYVGFAHAVPPTNTKFKPLLLPTQAGMPYTNTHNHRTSYFKSTLTFLGPAKCWKSICVARQKPEILAVLHYNNNF